MFGLVIGRMFSAPLAILGTVAAIAALCGCVKCMRCHLRDCGCLKRFLRMIGHDKFDDFELMVLVHEALFERKEKNPTIVRVTAGKHSVETDANTNGIFQQPLHILVEQGSEYVVIDLLDSRHRRLASLQLKTLEDVMLVQHEPERMYNMKQTDRRCRSPKVKLSMVVNTGKDVEEGLLSPGMSSDVDLLVRQQLLKCGEGLSEMEVLKQSCSGPLEVFEGLGKASLSWVSVLGPPTSRRWVMGIWHDQQDFDEKKQSWFEIDLLRIQSVQGDPARHNVFVIDYFDESRIRQTLTFRRVDRARDVWVEILSMLVQRAHESRKAMKRDKGYRTYLEPGSGSSRASSHSDSRRTTRKAKKSMFW